MAYAADLKSADGSFHRGGSSPPSGTKYPMNENLLNAKTAIALGVYAIKFDFARDIYGQAAQNEQLQL